MRTPLLIISIFYAISIIDGALGLGFNEIAYALFGWIMIGTVIWMWIIELRR